MKTYKLLYWGRNEDDSYDTPQTKLMEQKVLLSETNIVKLTSKDRPDFIEVLVNDGERMVMSTQLIHSFTESFE